MRQTKFITNSKGKKTGVILDIREYNSILEHLEELEDIKAFDKVKSMKSEPIQFEIAMKELSKSYV